MEEKSVAITLAIILCSLLSLPGAYSQTTRTEGCFTVNFACVDGSRCLTRENDRNGVCDALPDCSDGSDESNCGRGACTRRQYRCDNGNCVRGSDVCNGDNNCGDNSDEMQCGGVSVVGFVVGLTVGILGLVFGILCVVFCTIGWCIYCARKRAPKGSSINVRWTPKTKTVEANPDPPPYPRT